MPKHPDSQDVRHEIVPEGEVTTTKQPCCKARWASSTAVVIGGTPEGA